MFRQYLNTQAERLLITLNRSVADKQETKKQELCRRLTIPVIGERGNSGTESELPQNMRKRHILTKISQSYLSLAIKPRRTEVLPKAYHELIKASIGSGPMSAPFMCTGFGIGRSLKKKVPAAMIMSAAGWKAGWGSVC